MTLRPTREGLLVVRGFYEKDHGYARKYEHWEIYVSPAMKSLVARKSGPTGEETLLIFDPDKFGTEEASPIFWVYAPNARATRYFVGSAARRIFEAFGLVTETEWRRENGAFAP